MQFIVVFAKSWKLALYYLESLFYLAVSHLWQVEGGNLVLRHSVSNFLLNLETLHSDFDFLPNLRAIFRKGMPRLVLILVVSPMPTRSAVRC